jgi:hypothetical protein
MTAAALLFGLAGMAWAEDSGIPDTLYAEVYPPDTFTTVFVRVPLYVTHDIVDPATDSIAAFMIPLCYEHTNPATYCSLSLWWNNVSLYPSPERERSIFRHLDGETNWMMNLAEQGQGEEWDFLYLDLGDETSHFWFSMGVRDADRLFEEGNRVLILTLTFKVKDSTTICIDTCFWPPSDRLSFWTPYEHGGYDSYIPKIWDDYLGTEEYCFFVSYPKRGDVNADGTIDIEDVVFYLNYLFRHGPYPPSVKVSDTNCDGFADTSDIILLLNYIFKGGPPPEC